MIRLVSGLSFLLAVMPLQGLQTLRSLAELRALSPAEAAKSYPVEVEATVIYCDPLIPNVIVSDGTAGCYIGCPEPLVNRPKIRSGARVRITGVSNPATYFPDVKKAKIEFLSMGELPAPPRVTSAELYSRLIDSDWVEVPATVVGVEKDGIAFTLVVEIQGALFKADVPKQDDTAQRALNLMQKRVLLRGVVGTVSNTQRQLTGRHFFVPSLDEIFRGQVFLLNNFSGSGLSFKQFPGSVSFRGQSFSGPGLSFKHQFLGSVGGVRSFFLTFFFWKMIKQ